MEAGLLRRGCLPAWSREVRRDLMAADVQEIEHLNMAGDTVLPISILSSRVDFRLFVVPWDFR